jgi:pyruvate/2-oxoglutarate dehydrogenase complex dihydrolipoamide acyltransferase (E2) component
MDLLTKSHFEISNMIAYHNSNSNRDGSLKVAASTLNINHPSGGGVHLGTKQLDSHL